MLFKTVFNLLWFRKTEIVWIYKDILAFIWSFMNVQSISCKLSGDMPLTCLFALDKTHWAFEQ